MGNMSKSHLQTNESLKVTESKVASSMGAMEMFNPGEEESPKIGVKPSSDPFLPDAPEIVNIKKEQAAQEPDPFNVAALLNTGGDTTSMRCLNLFQRVTGIGKRSKKVGVESEEGEKNPNDFPTNNS